MNNWNERQVGRIEKHIGEPDKEDRHHVNEPASHDALHNKE